MPAVKVCCIASPAEAELAIGAGAAVLGLVTHMPSGPGVISDEAAATIAVHVRRVAPAVETYLLTSLTHADAIAEQHARCGTTALQLVDRVPHAELRRLRRACPGAKLVQVIHVLGDHAVDEARAAAPLVDALLLDSGNPHAPVKELGGTGRRHDWATSRRIRDAVWPLPAVPGRRTATPTTWPRPWPPCTRTGWTCAAACAAAARWMRHPMIEQHLDIPTADGAMNSFVVHPDEGGPFPVVLFYMDAPASARSCTTWRAGWPRWATSWCCPTCTTAARATSG
jgi:phosphoribosylanthranilate isomerase